MTILIKNGRVINPATGTDETLDVLVENGVVARTEKSIKEKCDRVIDAKGCFVMPGFIDMHVHLRDPGSRQAQGQQCTADLRRFLPCRTPSRSWIIRML